MFVDLSSVHDMERIVAFADIGQSKRRSDAESYSACPKWGGNHLLSGTSGEPQRYLFQRQTGVLGNRSPGNIEITSQIPLLQVRTCFHSEAAEPLSLEPAVAGHWLCVRAQFPTPHQIVDVMAYSANQVAPLRVWTLCAIPIQYPF